MLPYDPAAPMLTYSRSQATSTFISTKNADCFYFPVEAFGNATAWGLESGMFSSSFQLLLWSKSWGNSRAVPWCPGPADDPDSPAGGLVWTAAVCLSTRVLTKKADTAQCSVPGTWCSADLPEAWEQTSCWADGSWSPRAGENSLLLLPPETQKPLLLHPSSQDWYDLCVGPCGLPEGTPVGSPPTKGCWHEKHSGVSKWANRACKYRVRWSLSHRGSEGGDVAESGLAGIVDDLKQRDIQYFKIKWWPRTASSKFFFWGAVGVKWWGRWSKEMTKTFWKNLFTAFMVINKDLIINVENRKFVVNIIPMWVK